MNIQEAIEHAKEVSEKKYLEAMLCHANPDDGHLDECIECAREHEQLSEWLQELNKYKQLGTIEELRDAFGKHIPKKPVKKTDTIHFFMSKENYMHGIVEKEIESYHCPSCDSTLATQFMIDLNKMKRNNTNMFCAHCGQAIDWKE